MFAEKFVTHRAESIFELKFVLEYPEVLFADKNGEIKSHDTQRTLAHICREPWSQEYFTRLRAAHQNHYEQVYIFLDCSLASSNQRIFFYVSTFYAN
jgi:hypothetical protein